MCTRVHARIRNFMSVSIQRSVANHCTTWYGLDQSRFVPPVLQ